VYQERPPLGSSITVEGLGELPSSATIYALLDTAAPDVVADRLDTGGLSAGDPARVGAHGNTWTQTLFHLGDGDITDPSGKGTPMLSPGVEEWERVDVLTGIMPVDASAPGLAIFFIPRRPFDAWLGSLNLIDSPAFLNASGSMTPPSIMRLDTWAHVNVVAGGQVVPERLGAFTSASWTRSSHFERDSPDELDANLAAAFARFLVSPGSANQVELTGWAQRTRDPLANHMAIGQQTAAERDRALNVQGAWERLLSGGNAGMRTYGSYTARNRAAELQPVPFVVMERLTDGPVPSVLDPGNGTDTVWNVGGRVHGAIDSQDHGRHAILAGFDLSGSSTSTRSAFTGRVGELVNGLPARVWDFSDPASSFWHQTMITAYVSDSYAVLPRLTLNAGARLEIVRGFTGDASDSPAVSWNNWYPRAGLRALLTRFWETGAFGQFARYGHRLPLSDLAYGDPTAPTGSVYRWTGGDLAQSGALGPVVQRVGPGTGGNPLFSAIDPGLRRPYMDEFIFGFEARPHPTTFARIAAIARREQPLIGVVDIGVPDSSYSTIGVPDPGVDLKGPADAETLLFYNRSPATFGTDRYLLTNPPDHVATFVGVDVSAETRANRLFLIAGGTAGRSEGFSANRGFGPLENDAAVLGEVFIDPNARENAHGRLFTERGYTLKTALAYQFGHDVTASLIGRYEDGQHFARLVVMQNLNQGTEAVRAFPNGRTRFTFSMTVDARLQKSFGVGGHSVTAVIDAYNLFNQALEVEEFQVTGGGARLTSAVQPPRVLHIGLRIGL
jgi:hypothetical protein